MLELHLECYSVKSITNTPEIPYSSHYLLCLVITFFSKDNKTKILVSAREVMAERVSKRKKLWLKSKALRKMIETEKENDKSCKNIIKMLLKSKEKNSTVIKI